MKKAVYTSKFKRSGAILFSSIVNRQSLIVLFFSIFLFTIHYSLFTNSVHAQAPCPDVPAAKLTRDNFNREAITQSVYDSAIFNNDQFISTTDSLFTLLTGCSLIHPATNNITAGGGALAASSNLVASLYSVPPVSGIQYFADQFQKFNPVQPAYAQGLGYKALVPVQNVWSAFRNISYLGFVIVFIVIGFMIMFRAHISPQAVATVQDSLPRIVIALILVTFSYALAGLMIDAMFVLLNVAINALAVAGLNTTNADNVITNNVFKVVMSAQDGVFKSVFGAVSNIIKDLFDSGILGKVLGFLAGGLIGIIAGIAMLFVMFRVFIMLLMAYITIILLTIFAPFFFLIQALPGNNGAKDWFRQMAANIAVFPVVALMFILGGMLSGIPELGGSGTTRFTSQDVGQFPLLTGGLNVGKDIGPLIGLGMLLITPTAAAMIKDRLGVKGGPGAGAAAMAAVGAGAGVIGKGAGAAKNYALSDRSYLGQWQKAQALRRQEEISARAGIGTFTNPKPKNPYTPRSNR